MKKFFKWTGFVVAGLVVVLVLAISWVFFASASEMNHRFSQSQAAQLAIPGDEVSIAEGQRLARVAGCMDCHGAQLTGSVPLDIPNLVRFVAPNISGAVHEYTEAQWFDLMRRGVNREGRGVYFMPSEMYRNLSDADLGKVIAYVRTFKPADGIEEVTTVRPLGRFIIAKGDFQSAPRQIEALPAAKASFDAANPVDHGRYLTMSFCSECHGQQLQGRPEAHSPALTVAKGYAPEQFARLLSEGVGIGDRTFELMTPTAKSRFSNLTADEVAAIFAFLQSRG